jgi:hypothetical protein
MENKEKLKIVFDFIADYLSESNTDGKNNNTVVEHKSEVENDKVVLDEEKKKEVNRILNIMKSAEKIEKTSKISKGSIVVPPEERDSEETDETKVSVLL